VINGQPTGAVRVSFGYMSTFEDCLAVIRFIRKYFVESGGERTVKRIDETLNARISKGLSNLETSTASSGLMKDNSINGGIVDNDTHTTTSIQLESIMVYPIKSCAGFSVRVWPLSDCGKLTKPKAILFYQTCLLPFPMAFTFHWNILKRHTRMLSKV
jgi:molybdenum cofactor sulfurtransferase